MDEMEKEGFEEAFEAKNPETDKNENEKNADIYSECDIAPLGIACRDSSRRYGRIRRYKILQRICRRRANGFLVFCKGIGYSRGR